MEVLLVDVVAEDLGKMSCQHDLWIILNTEGADVVTTLLAESGLVLVLFKIKNICKNICFGFFLQIFRKKKNNVRGQLLTSLTMSLEALAATTETASLGRK